MLTNDPHSSDESAKELYDALRGLAVRTLGRGTRLEPTDLIHQAWVRLASSPRFDAVPRAEFLALCATVMRRIAIDESRRRVLEKRDSERVTLSLVPGETSGPQIDLLELDDALRELRLLDERWARIVELRFFGGLSGEEVAGALGLSRRTVLREWDFARAWLKRKLS